MNWIIVLSVCLRLIGVGYSLTLLSRTRDRRFGFLTLLLSFMTLRQALTMQTSSAGIEELLGLVVSVLTILTVYYLSTYVDEEATIKAQLQEANERLRGFRKAIEHAGHAIFLTDPDGTITYANPTIEKVTGHDPDAVIGENPRLWKSGKHDDSFYAEMWDQISSGSVWEGEVINRRASGELCWVDIRLKFSILTVRAPPRGDDSWMVFELLAQRAQNPVTLLNGFLRRLPTAIRPL